MGVISDYVANPKYGFVLATIFAAVLFIGLLLNRIFDPARDRLQQCDRSESDLAETETVGTQPRT